ncbi:hypothetical protein EI94DRAFT_1711089 [Lactarius quietus]|nr:hypothetical protein EI94DRAFT_1711089 [Lactarius quietus]
MTECVVPQLSKKKTSTKPSPQQHDHGDIPQTLNDTEERYPLHIHEDQEDPNDTLMKQWLDHRDRYLHLLLEMEGVTQAPKCSVCDRAMEVKCSDCIRGTYFCKACCLQSHRSSPFHWMSQWTGSHFMPGSLYSLGFVLCLGHQGHPCPVTVEGIQAAEKAHHSKKKSMQTKPASHKAINEETSPSPELPDISNAYLPAESLHYLSEPLFGHANPLIDRSHGNSKRLRTAALGNPLLTVVHQSGVFNMEVLYCICPNAGEKDEHVTFDWTYRLNLSSESTAKPPLMRVMDMAPTYQYKYDAIWNSIERDRSIEAIRRGQETERARGGGKYEIECENGPNDSPYDAKRCNKSSGQTVNIEPYRQLLRASRQWRDLRNRMQSGLGHQDDDGIDGSMAIFCPACPQPGINLPDDWKIRYNEYGFMIFMTMNQLVRTFIMDGNFAAEHMRCRSGDKDVPLSPGMAFMANLRHTRPTLKVPSTCNTYKAIEQANSSRPHLDVTGIGATACCHGFFMPASVVDFQKGESLCKALSYNMEDIPVALVMYDIMCQYGVHLSDRVEKSPELSIANSLELQTGIGLFHIHGHQDSCLPHFSPSYISGAKQVDGEIIETLWSPLNNISQSIRGMSLAHCQEVLDAHMNHSNWKNMVHMVPSILKRWKRMEVGMDLSADMFNSVNSLTKCLKKHTKRWLKSERNAQLKRSSDSTVMDIYDTVTVKVMLMHKVAPSLAEIQQKLISEESRDPTTHGQTSWIASGIRIQELQ